MCMLQPSAQVLNMPHLLAPSLLLNASNRPETFKNTFLDSEMGERGALGPWVPKPSGW